MQTRFTAAQLADPQIATAEQILRKCVHCGFCTATCPTYVLLGDELDSPRGRIYLIKEMLERDEPATAGVVEHIDRCLSCLGCMTTCPSGVHYQHLIDHARAHVERTYRRPLHDRLLRALLAMVLPYPRRFRAALRLATLARPLSGLLSARMRAMLVLARRSARGRPANRAHGPESRADGVGESRPDRATKRVSARAPRPNFEHAAAPAGRTASRPRRVALLDGCVQSVVGTSINAAAQRLLERIGIEVVTIPGCCGSIVHHLGRAAQNRALAAPLLERLLAEHADRELDAIVTTASGCGTHLKDYAHLFRDDADLAAKAKQVSASTRDVSELLWGLELPPVTLGAPPTVAYHSACSMQHGQGIDAAPRALLERAGFAVREVPEGHLCCGSAGTYNMLQPSLADRLKERKLANIARTGAAIVATGNIGCISQLGVGGGPPIVHTVELLDWATGGPTPRPCAVAAGVNAS